MRRAASIAIICVWAGCQGSPDAPESFVSGLRVLTARAQPPQASPGQVAQVDVLAVDTGARAVEATWSRCSLAPLAGEAFNSDCVTAETAPYLAPLGAGLSISVEMPQVTAGALGAPDATNGVYVPLVARVSDGADEVTAVYRLRLADAGPANANPMIAAVDVFDATGAGTPLDAAAPLAVHAGDALTLGVTLAPGSAETYVAPDGTTATEQLTTSWFCTAGLLSVDRTSDAQPHTVLQLDERPPSAGQQIDLYAVARDGRGGVDYIHRALELE